MITGKKINLKNFKKMKFQSNRLVNAPKTKTGKEKNRYHLNSH